MARVFIASVWILAIAMGIAWIVNIVKFIGMIGGDVTAMFIARGIGIFAAPLGAILGFF